MTAQMTNGDSIDTFAENETKQLSPLSLIANAISSLRNVIFPIVAVSFTLNDNVGYFWIMLIAIAIIAASVFIQWLRWKRFSYQVGTEEIRIASGIFSRNARSIPYERIQDVSVEQNLLARILNIASVKFETGGGEGEEGKLNYVSLIEAENLRQLVRVRKAAPTSDIAQPALGDETYQPAIDEVIFAMDVKRIFTLGMFNFSLAVFAIILGLAQQFEFLLPVSLETLIDRMLNRASSGEFAGTMNMANAYLGIIGGLFVTIIIGIFSGQIQTFLREYGFILTPTDRGIRRRRGLFTLTDVVMPLHRVQAAIVQTGPIRKRFGWHALKFTSLGTDTGKESSHMMAPLAQNAEYWPIAAQASITAPPNDLAFAHSHISYVAGAFPIALIFIMIAMSNVIFDYTDARLEWVAAAAVVPIAVSVLSWQHHNYAYDDSQIYVRNGYWNQKLTILPMIKTQSVDLLQGPLSQIIGVTDIKFGIAGGSGLSTLTIHNIPLNIARDIRADCINAARDIDFSDLIKAPKG